MGSATGRKIKALWIPMPISNQLRQPIRHDGAQLQVIRESAVGRYCTVSVLENRQGESDAVGLSRLRNTARSRSSSGISSSHVAKMEPRQSGQDTTALNAATEELHWRLALMCARTQSSWKRWLQPAIGCTESPGLNTSMQIAQSMCRGDSGEQQANTVELDESRS